MRLAANAFVPAAPAHAGVELLTLLMGPASPVPPGFRTVMESSTSSRAVAAVAGTPVSPHPRGPAVPPVPQNEQAFGTAMADLARQAEQQAVVIHQRGYGITEPGSPGASWLSTVQIAPCIVVMIHSPETRLGALAHVDADTTEGSLRAIVDQFPPAGSLDVSFHGGLDSAESRGTCERLLQALHDIEPAGSQRFVIRRFDVMQRPHGKEVSLDTSTGAVHASVGGATVGLDAGFRTLSDGTYLTGATGAELAGQCEALPAGAVRTAARNLRLQYDGRSTRWVAWRKAAGTRAAEATARTAIARAGKGGDPAPIVAAIERLDVPELVDSNLRSYFALGTKVGDTRFLVEALVVALINGDPPAKAVQTWRDQQRR